jgi:hypothetical protein
MDSDGDGIADRVETDSDSDGDGIPNHADDDSDGDTASDSMEARSTDPCTPADSDGDSIPDFLDLDSDNDGLRDVDEAAQGSNPTSSDSDDDGFSDFREHAAESDPNDPTSVIPETDLFVVLPYREDPVFNRVRFSSKVTQADVYLLMNTNRSMTTEVGNAQAGMELTTIPQIQEVIPNVFFGAGGFDDYPLGPHGETGDLPFYQLIGMVPFEQDTGAMGPMFAESSDVSTWAASGANGMPDIIDAIRAYPKHHGGNGCDAGIEAIYQIATGAGVSWPEGSNRWRMWDSGSIPASDCSSVATEFGPRRGYPCFRAGSLPIIVYVSDAPFHDPLPDGWARDTRDLEGSCTYSEVPDASRYETAVTALRDIGARVIALSTDTMPSDVLRFPATNHMCSLARETGSVRADGTPLCFELGLSGEMISRRMGEGIGELVNGTPHDIEGSVENIEGANPDDFDARMFIRSIVPVEAYRDGVPGVNRGVSYYRHDTTTFYEVIPGTELEFRIDLVNEVRPSGDFPQVFKARITAIGNRVARLSERRIFIIVPSQDGTHEL